MTDIQSIRRVSAYKTTDGVTHDNRNVALAHQATLDLLALVSRDNLMSHEIAAEIVARLLDHPELVEAARKAHARLVPELSEPV